MKKINAAAVLLMALAFSGAAHSQSAYSPPPDRGWYLGGSIGEGEWKDFCNGVNASCDKKDTAWRIFGGYQISRNFGVELGYADLGEATIAGPLASAKAEGTAWDLVGIAMLPLGPDGRFSIYGKLGGYYGEVKGESTAAVFGFSSAGSAKEHNTDFTYGLGVGYNFTRNFGVRGEWQRYQNFGDNRLGGETDMDVLSIGVLYRF